MKGRKCMVNVLQRFMGFKKCKVEMLKGLKGMVFMPSFMEVLQRFLGNEKYKVVILGLKGMVNGLLIVLQRFLGNKKGKVVF